MGYMAGWYLRCLLGSQQRRTAYIVYYIQPGKRSAPGTSHCNLPSQKQQAQKAVTVSTLHVLQMGPALMLTMPIGDLSCTAILFSAICIGIVSQTYPVMCYCSSFGLAGIVMIMNSQTWQSCWQKARHFTSKHAGLIALLIENVGWALI